MKNLPSDVLLAATLRSIGDGVISCDHEGSVVLMNAVAAELTGWPQDEAIGRNLKEVFVIVNEVTRRTVEDPVDKVLRLCEIVGMENHTILIRRDGTELFIDDSAAPVLDGDGELQGVVLVFRDVTKRRRAEWNVEMLSESGRVLGEAREVEPILERISQVIATHFADFCVFDLLTENGGLKRKVGRHRIPELQGIADGMVQFQPPPAPSVHPVRQVLETKHSQLLADPTEHILEQMTVGPEHRAYYEEELKAKSILSVPLIVGDDLLGVLTCVRHRLPLPYDALDIAATEELGKRIGLAMHYAQVRDELYMQRARVEAMTAAVPVGIVMAEKSGRIVQVNEEANRIFRHESRYSKDVESHGEYVAFHPDGRRVQGDEYPLARAIAEGRVIRDERYLYAKGDGTKGWISLSAAPVKDETGYIWGGVVAISDIDQLVTAQHMAERSEKRVQTMMARASVGVAVGDFDGGLSYANDVLLSWIGYSKEELERGELRWDKITPPEFAERDENAMRELRRDCFCTPYEKAYFAKDGHRVPLLVGATCIPSMDGEQKDDVAVFFTDLTLQKRAEQILLQTEKLTAVGRLASSISHEINNPLEAVTNLLYIVRNSPGLAQSDKDYLEAADREPSRVSQITAQTLRFHRQSTAATEVRPENLLGEVIAIYKTRLAGSNITIEHDYGKTVAFTCYEGDIRQVLSNLVGNAFDSMRNGGKLRLRTRCATWWPTGEAGVLLTIADTGSGMSLDVQKRIFEAFYSTKGIHGTGLGLWISKRIIHKHRGHLCVRSSTGLRHGTVFQLWMPLELAATANESWHEDDGVTDLNSSSQ